MDEPSILYSPSTEIELTFEACLRAKTDALYSEADSALIPSPGTADSDSVPAFRLSITMRVLLLG